MEEAKKDESQEQKQPQEVVLTIKLHEDGNITVHGPITEEMLAFYMLP